MMPSHRPSQACRQLALEQNQRLLDQAYALDHSAFTLLERPGLDARRFDRYQMLRRKAAERYMEALEHRGVIERAFSDSLAGPQDRSPQR